MGNLPSATPTTPPARTSEGAFTLDPDRLTFYPGGHVSEWAASVEVILDKDGALTFAACPPWVDNEPLDLEDVVARMTPAQAYGLVQVLTTFLDQLVQPACERPARVA